MKRIVFILPVFAFLSCGGGESETTAVEENVEDTIYKNDHEWVVNAQQLKTKLGKLQASFAEIGNKEVDETICTETSMIRYDGNTAEMNVWLISTYMLDNFSADNFGKNNFKMPDAKIKEVTPLSELNWMNINGSDSTMFDVYKNYPDLKDVPKTAETELQKANMVFSAIDDGLLGVIAITDYLPPTFESNTRYETGYVMGYIMFADWETGELSCISPFLGQNSEPKMREFGSLDNLKVDLQAETFAAIDSIARKRTGFEGDVLVNDAGRLEGYRE